MFISISGKILSLLDFEVVIDMFLCLFNCLTLKKLSDFNFRLKTLLKVPFGKNIEGIKQTKKEIRQGN